MQLGIIQLGIIQLGIIHKVSLFTCLHYLLELLNIY